MESTKTEITIADIESHTKRHGRKATAQLLNLLGRKRPLYDIVMSPGGQALFSTLVETLDMLLDKIIENKASDEEIMEYRVSVRVLKNSATLLSNYNKHSDMLKGVK